MRTVLEDLTLPHKESMPWLYNHVFYIVRSGSHAYGTNLPTSDLDFKGVTFTPREYLLGFVKKFEQAECKVPYDAVIYDIKKFFNLAADCNPSIMEVLFVDPVDVVYSSWWAEHLRANANLFLSKKARFTFTGYAISQLNRIKRHYNWLHNPPKHEPTRADFGLPERTVIPADQRAAVDNAIKNKMQEWDLGFEDPVLNIAIRDRVAKTLAEIQITEDTIWKNAARAIGVDDNFIHLMEIERAYNNARNEWNQYLTWQRQRNPARAELEAKFGYDTKHGMHLVRLMRMGLEIMTTGKVIVKRPDAEELLAIRAGKWPYEQMVQFAQDMEAKINASYDKSMLPKVPNREALDKLCINMVEDYLER